MVESVAIPDPQPVVVRLLLFTFVLKFDGKALVYHGVDRGMRRTHRWSPVTN